MGLLKIFINIFDPLKIIRRHICYPFFKVASTFLDHYRSKANEGVSNVRDLVLRFGIISFAVAIIIWSAVFMYIAFYYAYMPTLAHTRPVHLQFQSCPDEKGPCSFPYAHVSLSKRQQILMVGQAYKVLVNIDMPESPQNQNLGMFMVCADMRDRASLLRGHSCRSAMLRYRSPLIQLLSTWIFSPLIVFGFKEEHQLIPVELFSNYQEEYSHPVTDVYVEIQSKHIQFYSVTLHIMADFTGLRYIMFHWPILSAALGISTNLFFILTVFVLSWYHWLDLTWIKQVHEKYQKYRSRYDILTGTIDDSNSLFDDDDLTILDEKSDEVEDISGGEADDNDSIGKKEFHKKITQTDY